MNNGADNKTKTERRTNVLRSVAASIAMKHQILVVERVCRHTLKIIYSTLRITRRYNCMYGKRCMSHGDCSFSRTHVRSDYLVFNVFNMFEFRHRECELNTTLKHKHQKNNKIDWLPIWYKSYLKRICKNVKPTMDES